MKLAILTFLIFSCSVVGGKTVSEAPETIKKEAETKTEDDNKEDETKTEDDNVVAVAGWTPAEDTGKDQEMVNNLKEMKKMLDEQISYWETLVAAAPGENKEKEGSGDEEKEVSVDKEKEVSVDEEKEVSVDEEKEVSGAKSVTGDKKADKKRRRRRRF